MFGTIIPKLVSLLAALSVLISSLTGYSSRSGQAEPTLEPPVWPAWVHTHWVWEHNGTSESAMNFVNGFLDHGIPVGVVNIDYPWAMGVGTFIPNPDLYPDLKDQIKKFHDMNIRVTLWATCMVNENDSNFQEGKDKGYFLSNGRTVKWWLGKGAFVDYTNPEAVTWWHTQMDKALDLGIDGWKVDGADPYEMTLITPLGHDGKFVTWKAYSDLFYRDFFEYTREKLGNDRVIFTRPVNDVVLKAGLPFVFSDRDINFAGWVGDNDNDWGGIRHALNDMFSSSNFNFVSYGSDIGGFRSDGNKYKDVFIRWAQLGAFCPIMENGGGGEHRPWMYDEETTDIYRKFVTLHDDLLPYIYSQAAYSYELVIPTMRTQLGMYEYLLGSDILVAPFYQAGNDRTVVFPKGDWIYMFDESKTYKGGIKKLSFGLDEFPVFIRKGAIIPMDVANSENGFGTELSKNYTTIAMYPKTGEKKFGLYEEKEKGTMISYAKDKSSLNITSTPSKRPLLFRVYGEPVPLSVHTGSGTALAKASSMAELVTLPTGYFIDGGITWIAVKDVNGGAEIQVKY